MSKRARVIQIRMVPNGRQNRLRQDIVRALDVREKGAHVDRLIDVLHLEIAGHRAIEELDVSTEMRNAFLKRAVDVQELHGPVRPGHVAFECGTNAHV